MRIAEMTALTESVHWSESVLSVLTESPVRPIEVHTVHVPPLTESMVDGRSGATLRVKIRKVETLESLYASLAHTSTHLLAAPLAVDETAGFGSAV
jgi:hypothetical protein